MGAGWVINSDFTRHLLINVDSKKKYILKYEGELYKLVDGKMRELYFKLVHKDLYFFMTLPCSMWDLRSGIIRSMPPCIGSMES